MAFWGLVLVAFGLGFLLGIDIWPLMAVVVGVALLISAASGRSDRNNPLGMWSCWPTLYRNRDPGGGDQERDLRHRATSE